MVGMVDMVSLFLRRRKIADRPRHADQHQNLVFQSLPVVPVSTS